MTPKKTRRFRPWTRRDWQQLRRQFHNGGIVNIRLDGRSRKAIDHQLRKLGLRQSRRTIRRWTRRDDQLLILLKKYRGLSLAAIWRQFFPGRTYAAVKSRVRQRDLVSPERSAQSKRSLVMTSNETAEFHRFLAGPGRQMPTADIAANFQIGISRVWRHRRKLGLRFTMADARSLPEHHAKVQAVAAKLRELNQQRLRTWREKRLRAMTHWAMKLRERQPKCPERTCRRCGKIWPEDKHFFFPVKVRGKRGQKKYLSHTCRPCANQRKVAWQSRQ